VNSQLVDLHNSSYCIFTEIYAGPLDLLLNLIERAELDITKLALAQVTDQYLSYLHHLEVLDPANISSFLVIASKLLQIKSEALLPRQKERGPDEEDPGVALTNQLLTYRLYKQAAEWLAHRELAHLRTYLHLPTQPKIPGKLDRDEVTLLELVNAAHSILIVQPAQLFISEIVSLSGISIREKIKAVINNLQQNSQTTFRRLLSQNRSKLETVITFLAILELIKRKIVIVQQEGLFTDINIKLLDEWNPSDDLAFEFDE
jgi:segregation and condensation protein A